MPGLKIRGLRCFFFKSIYRTKYMQGGAPKIAKLVNNTLITYGFVGDVSN